MRIAISGVNRGMGEGFARLAVDQEHQVLGFGRREPVWAAESAGFRFVECDMADAVGLGAACAIVEGPLDVLLCSAATFADGAGTIEHFHPQAMLDALAVNTVAPLIMARSLKANLEAGTRRLIVMMSTGNASLAGNVTGTLLGYRLSKTALNQAVRNLAAEWDGFTVVALNPGWVRTDMGGPDAELSVEEAAARIMEFVDRVSLAGEFNGAFVNPDGSPLPW